MALVIDPTQKRDQHCKIYLEKDVVDLIKAYQFRKGYLSFSEAGRQLLLEGLGPHGTGPLQRATNALTADG